MLLEWILHRWSWKSFAVGAGAVMFGGTVARPVLVHAVKTGMDVTDYATETWQQARAEADRIRAEAVQLRTAAAPVLNDLVTELQKLRGEVASLRASVETKSETKSPSRS
jgi:hypothetical protein